MGALRMRAVALAVLIISSTLLTPAAKSQTTDAAAPTTECDTFAADPFDPQHKAEGGPFEKLNSAVAIPGCKSAVQQYPDSKRLAYQLGRALCTSA
jgi:hypothetical protein